MADKKIKNLFFSKFFLLGSFTLAIFLTFVYARAYYQDYQVRQEIVKMREEARRLEVKKMESLELLRFVRTPAFLEAKARTEFNMIKPGEKVAFIGSGGEERGVGQETKKVLESNDLYNIIKWWRLFFK